LPDIPGDFTIRPIPSKILMGWFEPKEFKMTFAKRTAHLRAEGAYQVLAQALALEAQGRDIIHLEVGQPDIVGFPNVMHAGMEAIRDGYTRYTPPAGMMELRQAIAEDAGRRRGMQFQARQVVVSPGAKPNLFFPTLALVEPGDEVIYPDPGFPTYEAMIGVAGGIPVPLPLKEETQFSFDLKALDNLVSDRTRMIVLNSPSNPTGGVLPPSDLEHIAQVAHDFDLWVLSDEIYSRMVYDGIEALSIAALPGMFERSVIIDGFSKSYAMHGWRLGYGIMPLELAEKIELLLTHSVGCPAHFTQIAALEALQGDQQQVEDYVAEYQRRRDVLVQGLNRIPGLSCQTPQGAFYTFPNITALGKTSDELANLILDQGGVAVLPGTAFGRNGEGYLRLSYANSMENIEEALGRMAEVLRAL
jgi:aspartate/methionine/tyrosine aminotransferase